jgi:NADH-quinone oxidoreductase subunit I
MKVTMRHLFTPAVTIQYPDARMSIPERGRNRLYVNMDDCIGCDQCAMACPVDCITIETAKSLSTEDLGVTSTGQKKRLWVTQFDIDFGKCCYCGLCVPPCPTECIYMTSVFEFSDYDRKNLIYSFITLTPGEVAQKVKQAQQAEREAAAKKAAASAAAAAQKAAQAAQKPAPTPEEATQKPAASTAQQSTSSDSPGKQEDKKMESREAKPGQEPTSSAGDNPHESKTD